MLDIRTPPARPLFAPSILSADFGRMQADCAEAFALGADMLHIDVMDGHFVPNLTMGGDMVRALRRHFPEAFLDCHLMVERPDLFAAGFAEVGANAFSFHVEACDVCRGAAGIDGAKLIGEVRKLGMHPGIVLNPPTAVETLLPFLPLVDFVLVMSVNPGRSGQSFISAALDKARFIKARLRPDQRLEMDGGIKPENIREVTAAGVDMMVAASAFFGAKDRAAAARQLRGL